MQVERLKTAGLLLALCAPKSSENVLPKSPSQIGDTAEGPNESAQRGGSGVGRVKKPLLCITTTDPFQVE